MSAVRRLTLSIPVQRLNFRCCISEKWERYTGGTFTKMPVEPGLVDANVLAYSINADAPQHRASRSLLKAACDPVITLFVTIPVQNNFVQPLFHSPTG